MKRSVATSGWRFRIAYARERTPNRARIEVMKEFGNVALAMEDTRSVWGGQWLEQLAFDLRYAARSLARTPGFAVAAVLSLAIGIGATTALFSVLQHVAWQPLPYRNPDKLAIVWNLDPRLANPQSPASFPDWQDWRSQSKGFAGLAMFRNRPGFLQAGEQSPQLELHEVSADFLPLLGVAPALGRFWSEDESARGQAAVISDHLWRQAFGGARDIVGRRIVVSQTPYEIVGVMPAGFPLAFDGYADYHPALSGGFHLGAVRSQTGAEGESRQSRTAHPGAA